MSIRTRRTLRDSPARRAVAIMGAMSEVAVKAMPRRGRLWVIADPRPGPVRARLRDRQHLDPEAGRAVVHIAGIAEAQEIFGGVPQEGDRLGSSDAPVTIQVFNDMQCSDCREDFLSTIPALAENYARPGDVQLLYRHYSNSENAERARLLRRRGGGRTGLRLAVHLPLLPQPGRSRTLRRRPGLPRLDRRRRRGTERRPNGKKRWKKTAAPTAPIAKRLEGYEELGRDLGIRVRPGGDRHRPERHRNAAGRPVAGSDRTGDRSGAVIRRAAPEPARESRRQPSDPGKMSATIRAGKRPARRGRDEQVESRRLGTGQIRGMCACVAVLIAGLVLTVTPTHAKAAPAYRYLNSSPRRTAFSRSTSRPPVGR